MTFVGALAGLLVVRRIDWFALGPATAPTPSINLSHDAILRHYRGIEGDPWPCDTRQIPLEHGLAPDSAYADALRCYEEKSKQALVDFIHIRTLVRLADVGDGSTGLGFELGYYKSEYSAYSVIINEIIYGTHAALRQYGSQLNEHLLFSTIEQAEDARLMCLKLLEAGTHLETSEPFEVISVRDPVAR